MGSPLRFVPHPRRHLRTVVVPLLEPRHTRHAVELACRLAVRRASRILLLAPLAVDWELPLDAYFDEEEARLHAELAAERALAESYGLTAHTEIVRARPGELGRRVAEAARDRRAALIVLGAPPTPAGGRGRPFSQEVWSVLVDAPCPVMIATGAASAAA